MKTIIVTKHAPAIEWLRGQGIEGKVITHVTSPEQIAGCHVIGNLPLYLAVYAAKITMILLPGRQETQRHQEMTVAEMEEAGAYLASFVVTEAE